MFTDVSGVTTDGLTYPLHEATLKLGSAFSVSNEMVGDQARVSIREGVMLVLQSPLPLP